MERRGVGSRAVRPALFEQRRGDQPGGDVDRSLAVPGVDERVERDASAGHLPVAAHAPESLERLPEGGPDVLVRVRRTGAQLQFVADDAEDDDRGDAFEVEEEVGGLRERVAFLGRLDARDESVRANAPVRDGLAERVDRRGRVRRRQQLLEQRDVDVGVEELGGDVLVGRRAAGEVERLAADREQEPRGEVGVGNDVEVVEVLDEDGRGSAERLAVVDERRVDAVGGVVVDEMSTDTSGGSRLFSPGVEWSTSASRS